MIGGEKGAGAPTENLIGRVETRDKISRQGENEKITVSLVIKRKVLTLTLTNFIPHIIVESYCMNL